MRKLTTLMYFFMASALFLTSCGGDDEEGETPTPEVQTPTLAFLAGGPVTNGATVSAKPGETLTFTITGKKVDKNLKEVTFLEGNDAIVNPANITIENEIQKENPVDISNKDNDTFQWDVELKLGADGSTTKYQIILSDNDDLKSTLSFTVVVSSTSSDNVPKLYSQNGLGDASTIGSFYSTTNNKTYATTAAATNINSLDFALNEPSNGTYKLVRPQGQTTGNTTITSSTAAKTVFSTTSLTFASVTSSELSAASATATEIALTSGSTYFFYNSNTNVKGLIKINSIDTANDYISFDVKYIIEESVVLVETKK